MLSDGDHVRNLLGRYCERLDAGDLDGVGALFAARPAGHRGRDGPRHRRRRGGRVLPPGHPAARRLAAHEAPRRRHRARAVRATARRSSPGRRTSCSRRSTGCSPLQPIIAGRYVDTFDRTADGWSWIERRFAVDLHRRPVPPPGVPAVSTALVTGRRLGDRRRRRPPAPGRRVRRRRRRSHPGRGRASAATSPPRRRSRRSWRELDRLDVVANVAGIPQFGRAETITDDEWDRVLAVDLTGPFKVVRAALPLLKASRGCIVNLASVAGIQGQAYTAAYSAAKGGLVMLTKALAVELAPDGVRVNCVCPGGVDTPLLRQVALPRRRRPRAARPADRARSPAPRWPPPSRWPTRWPGWSRPGAASVTGIALPMDGGRSA